MLADLGRLIILILLLPVFLIFVGPMLVVAVLRGRQPLGPILLDTTRYRAIAKASAFIFGVALWGVIWGGLAWLSVNAIAPALSTGSPLDTPAEVTILITNTPTSILSDSTATPRPSPTPTPVLDTATPLLPAATPTDPPAPAPTDTPLSTATALPPTSTFTPTPTATAAATQTRTSPVSPQATLTYQEQKRVEDVVKEANRLLQQAIVDANDETLANLDSVWRDLALNVAQSFALKTYEQYSKPVQVQFSYVRQPVVEPESTFTEATVTSREKWIYGRNDDAEDETFEFVYTLTRENEAWVITRYTYRNLPNANSSP